MKILKRLVNRFIIFLYDFFDDAVTERATRLAAARREVIAVQLLSAEERDFPFTGGHRFHDPESSDERRVDAVAVRKDYLQRFGVARAQLASHLTASGVRNTVHVLDEPLDAPLQRLFGERKQRA